jgi:restriction system protein
MRKKRRQELTTFILEQVSKHRPALTRNYRLAVKRNDYGAVSQDRRAEVVLEFLNSIGLDGSDLSFDEAVVLVIDEVERVIDDTKLEPFDPTRIPVDGVEFENWVASSLRGFGWHCELTKGSGDQGIDVIAQKDGFRIGLQCKLYSQPVGNRAIQEALAGMQFHGLHKAAVLTNAPFTRAAHELATVTNVLLLSHYDIPRLEGLAKQSS